jgi:hypothetical protein
MALSTIMTTAAVARLIKMIPTLQRQRSLGRLAPLPGHGPWPQHHRKARVLQLVVHLQRVHRHAHLGECKEHTAWVAANPADQ